MKPYTGKGDDGKTSDLTGSRIWKDDYLIEVIGTIDEATASIGLAKGFIKDSNKCRQYSMHFCTNFNFI